MKEQYRKTVKDNLKNKKLVIFGAGEVATAFYEEYRDELDFEFCITNNSSEWGEKRFHDELDIRQFAAHELKGEYYIILCTALAFDNVATQLECEDYIVFEDFADHKIVEAVIENKKIALFYGTCILRDVYKLLLDVPAFCDEYVSCFVQFTKKETIADVRRLYYGKEVCDAYIYARKLITTSKSYNMQKEDLPDDCIIIGSSNLLFQGYWPQLHGGMDYNENWQFGVDAAFDNYFWHMMYSREDYNVTKLLQEGHTPEEIADILSSEDYYTEKEIKRHLRVCFKSIEMAENGLQATVGDFIRRNYLKERVYQDLIHPAKGVLWHYVDRILEYLNIEEPQLNKIISEAAEYVHRSSDTPIYPSVAKYLELEWINENTTYEVLTYQGIRMMTFKEYMLHFATYTQKALEIKKGW